METSLPPVTPVAQKTNVLSIVSLIAGILGFLSSCLSIVPVLGYVCMGIGGLLGIVGIITGIIGMGKVKANGEKGKGMAVAGLVLGILTLLGICIMVIITLVAGPVIGNIFSGITNSLNTGY